MDITCTQLDIRHHTCDIAHACRETLRGALERCVVDDEGDVVTMMMVVTMICMMVVERIPHPYLTHTGHTATPSTPGKRSTLCELQTDREGH